MKSELTENEIRKLIKIAAEWRDRAYAPYSRYHVGCAILLESGEVVGGCNVENLSYGATLCAERVAVCTAVASGKTQFKAIVLSTLNDEFVAPCGLCRQVIAEFSSSVPIYMSNKQGAFERTTISELLPHAFSKKDLESGQI